MKTLAFFTVLDGIMWGRKCQRKDICALICTSSALSGASGLLYNVGLLAGPWFEGRMAQCLTDILGGGPRPQPW